MSRPHKIAIAADHAGYALKEAIKKALGDYEWLDLGTDSENSVDYPDFGYAMAACLHSGEALRGVLVCGSGIGISIAANRHPHIRAALCTDATMARLARSHNDANVLALGSRITGETVAIDCVNAFIATEFEGGRHQRRVDKLATIC